MPKKPTKNREIERLAKFFTFVYEANFLNYKRLIALSLLRGFWQGVGAFVGATLGAGLLLWIASLLLDVPLLGSIVEALRSVAR